MKIAGFCASLSLCMAATHGGISVALGASGPPLRQSPVSPSSAATPPAADMPATGAAPDALAPSPQNPNLTPMPTPAPTSHYAGPEKNPFGPGHTRFQSGLELSCCGMIRSNT